MSVEAVTFAFSVDPGNSGKKLLLAALGNEADKAGVTFVGQVALAEACSCTRETVSRNMGELERDGFIARVQRRRANGSRTSDYTILAPGWKNRGQMRMASLDEAPAAVHMLTVPGGGGTSHADSSRDAQTEDHVRISRGPDPVEDKGASPQGGSARTSTRPRDQLLREASDPVRKAIVVLDRVAAVKSCGKAGVESVAAALARYPELDGEAVALDLEFWALHGNGKPRKIKQLAGTYGNFMRKAEEDRKRALEQGGSARKPPGSSVQSGVQTPPDGQNSLDDVIRLED